MGSLDSLGNIGIVRFHCFLSFYLCTRSDALRRAYSMVLRNECGYT
jgi:hypothetical protein